MKKLTTIAFSLVLSATLAGCGQQGEAPKTEEKAEMADDAGTMAAPAETRHGKGTATVTAIDSAKGQVTLDHGAIAELESAMKGDDQAQIEAKSKALEEAGQSLYAAAAAAAQGDAGSAGTAGGSASGTPDDVVDAEFTEVKDDDKK